DITDVRLSIDCERNVLPQIQLQLSHVEEGLSGCRVVWKRIWQIAGMTFAPESIHHQVNKLHDWIIVELPHQQFIQFLKSSLEFGVIISRLNKVCFCTIGFSNLDQGNLFLQEVWQSKSAGLELRIRHLNTKGNSQVVPFSSVQGQVEYRIEIEFSGRRLDITPITTNVQDVNEGKRSSTPMCKKS